MEDDPNSDPVQPGAPAQPVWDSGDTGDVVTISAPVHTINWAMVGIFLLGAFWLYSSLSAHGEDEYEDE